MNKKKLIKRIFIGLGIFLVLFIGALVAIPFLFKDEIMEGIKQAANENLNAKLEFAGVDVSLLRSFPSVSIGLNEYSITGIDEFEGVKLVGGEALRIAVDFWSAWNFGKVPLVIESVTLDKPEINIIVLENGQANYDIAKPSADTTTTEETKFQIQLQEYAINEGNITYDDRLGGTFLKLVNLNHSGEGDFTQDVFDLNTRTRIDEMTAEAGGVPYLKKAKVSFDAGFNIDLPNSKYTLRDNDLKINELQLKADGWLAMPNENDMDMDLKFSAPQSEFKALLSMIPNAYTAGYDNVKAGGSFKLDGVVKGKYSSSPAAYPSFNINLEVLNGDVKYPDLPLGISNINTALNVNSPGSDLDQMLVDISKFNLKIGSNPIEGYFKLRTPMSDPAVDTKIKGTLNLEELSKAFPMEGVKSLTGLINSDIAVKTSMSTIDRGDYANVDMSGSASMKNLNYLAEGMPAVNIGAMQLDFTPQAVNIPSFNMKLGKSDLSGNGRVDNILAYFSPDKTMKGSFTLRSNYFDANEWVTEEEGQAASPSAEPASSDEEVFNRFDFTLDAVLGKVDYDVYQITDFVAKGNFTPSKLSVSQLSGKMGQSDFAASGNLTNIWNYLFSNEKLGGNLSLRSNYMNLNQFMTEGDAPAATATAAPAEASEPFLVPENMDLKVEANMGTVIYDDMELKNVKGALLVKNESVRFDNLSANSLGGSMNITGGYDTKNHEKPKFDFGMKLNRIDFQQAFSKFNTFQMIAPIGKYLQGTFNTDLNLSSDLKKDLMPDMATLAASGLLETLNGKISLAPPLQEIGNKLNVDAFKKLNLQNTKNWFTVKDGAVLLDEFKHSYDGIDMRIGGSHKLTGDMDYHIIAKIPRSKIGKNPLGAAANSGLDFLSGEAKKLGLNVNAGEFINVQINLGGTMDKPKVGFKVLGSEGTATDIGTTITNKAEEEAKKKLEETKAAAVKMAEEERKKLEEKARKEKERLEAEAKRRLEDEAKKRLDEKTKKAAEEAAKKAEKKIGDEAKKKVDDLLKKKKN